MQVNKPDYDQGEGNEDSLIVFHQTYGVLFPQSYFVVNGGIEVDEDMWVPMPVLMKGCSHWVSIDKACSEITLLSLFNRPFICIFGSYLDLLISNINKSWLSSGSIHSSRHCDKCFNVVPFVGKRRKYLLSPYYWICYSIFGLSLSHIRYFCLSLLSLTYYCANFHLDVYILPI